MPTPTGLPKAGEVWQRTHALPGREPVSFQFVVLARGGGSYWSLRVYVPGKGRVLWVDPAYWFAQGQLAYVGPAGPETRAKLGLS